MRRLWGYVKRLFGVTERYTRGDGGVITIKNSYKTLPNDTLESWLLRTRKMTLQQYAKLPDGYQRMLESQYLHDKVGRGIATAVEEVEYNKSK